MYVYSRGENPPGFTGHKGGTHIYCKPPYRGDKHVWRIDKQGGTNTLGLNNVLGEDTNALAIVCDHLEA